MSAHTRRPFYRSVCSTVLGPMPHCIAVVRRIIRHFADTQFPILSPNGVAPTGSNLWHMDLVITNVSIDRSICAHDLRTLDPDPHEPAGPQTASLMVFHAKFANIHRLHGA